MTVEHSEIMEQVKGDLSGLVANVKYNDVIYLDYPVHHNIGDLLIFLGATSLLKKERKNIVLGAMCDENVIELVSKTLAKYNGECTIIMHGGGNFGDLYPIHQNCRRDIVNNFPDANIIFFPQTIFYNDENVLEADKRLFGSHKDLSIYVRDKRSFEITKNLTDKHYLSADTAHMLWNESGFSAEAGQGVLNLTRYDIESKAEKVGFDWENLITKRDELIKRVICKFARKNHSPLVANILFRLWRYQSGRLSKRAAKYFNQFAAVKTDRLHGHILSCLISKPNTVSDNSYGKNSSYIELWTAQSPLVKLVKEQ